MCAKRIAEIVHFIIADKTEGEIMPLDRHKLQVAQLWQRDRATHVSSRRF